MTQSNCPVCDNKGFVAAAPLSCLPTNHRRGGAWVSAHHGQHRKALWSRALTIPCWVCGSLAFGGAA